MIQEFIPTNIPMSELNNSNEKDNITIKFTNPDQVYFTNEDIEGVIFISLSEDILADSIIVYFLAEKSSGSPINIPTISQKATSADINEDYTANLLKQNKNKNKKGKVHPELVQPFEKKRYEEVLSYKIPIFKFTKNLVAAGEYKFPFCLTVNDIKFPSIEYENHETIFYFSMRYKLVAELLPIDQDYSSSSNSLDEYDLIRKNKLKTETYLKIIVDCDINNDFILRTSTSQSSYLDKFQIINSILTPSKCFLPKISHVICSFNENHCLNQKEKICLEIKFDMDRNDKTLKDINIDIKLLQEIEFVQEKIKENCLPTLKSYFDYSMLLPQGMISANLLIQDELPATFESSILIVKYSLVIGIQMNGFCGRQVKTISFPIKVSSKLHKSKRHGNKKVTKFMENAVKSSNYDVNDDGIITMPVMRFKLENCWNMLFKEDELDNKKETNNEEHDDDEHD